MGLYGNPVLTGNERVMRPDELIVTKTDLTGRITYGNRTFYRFADYGEAACLGKQHNLIRHPEMPRAVFKLMWDTLTAGEEIFAYVNNRARTGDHYWVFAHVTPSRDAGGTTVGYHSNRRAPNRDVIEAAIKPLYADLLATERAAPDPKAGMAAAEAKVLDLLAANGVTFNQFIFGLGL